MVSSRHTLLRRLDTIGIFATTFVWETIVTFSFVFLHSKVLLKGTYPTRKEFAPFGSSIWWGFWDKNVSAAVLGQNKKNVSVAFLGQNRVCSGSGTIHPLGLSPPTGGPQPLFQTACSLITQPVFDGSNPQLQLISKIGQSIVEWKIYPL